MDQLSWYNKDLVYVIEYELDAYLPQILYEAPTGR